jgi:hypothetical protein
MGTEEHKSGLRVRKIVHPLGVQHRMTLEDSVLVGCGASVWAAVVAAHAGRGTSIIVLLVSCRPDTLPHLRAHRSQ